MECEPDAGPLSYPEQVQAVTTLQSGRMIDNETEEELSKGENEEENRVVPNVDSHTLSSSSLEHKPLNPTPATRRTKPHLTPHRAFHVPPVAPPTAPRTPSIFRNEALTESIWDMFKQVRVDKPLLDGTKQSPMFKEFLKDLSTQEQESRVHMDELVNQAEHMSFMILGHLVPKLKSPGSPTILCIICNHAFDGSLLDLGASVNILPYSAYKKLNLKKLQPTPVTLCLADQSLQKPWGVIEDAIVKVEEFHYPVDYIILDMKPSTNPIPILLG
ncbi:uncharacterized protein LOC131160838 [Malania oleifera]|uniref:uncharacterized protein LOC131160838 n=1 Tax=Malania oleifera TaxID=397392 RepID=UPI0025AEB9FA|nr:uncharacterized protein LOC131160838 [Malania oleifera]